MTMRETIARAIHDGPNAQAQYAAALIPAHGYDECPAVEQYLADADAVLGVLDPRTGLTPDEYPVGLPSDPNTHAGRTERALTEARAEIERLRGVCDSWNPPEWVMFTATGARPEPHPEQPWEHPGHRPVQHRDAQPPWCRECGWTSPVPARPAVQVRS